MLVSKWVRFGKMVTYREARLSGVDIELDEDGKPINCTLTITRHNEANDLVGLALRISEEEMYKIFMGVDRWQYKQREYGEKVMIQERQKAGLK